MEIYTEKGVQLLACLPAYLPTQPMELKEETAARKVFLFLSGPNKTQSTHCTCV
jgi:hypothetical protein